MAEANPPKAHCSTSTGKAQAANLVWEQILSKVEDPVDIVNCARVCKEWNSIVSNNEKQIEDAACAKAFDKMSLNDSKGSSSKGDSNANK